MPSLRTIIKRILKMIAPTLPINKFRIALLRSCGYNIGKDVYIGERIIIVDELADKDNLFIGDRVAVAPGVILITSSEPNFSKIRQHVKTEKGPIKIKHDAWIGAGSIIFPNVTIGEGSVVGAGAVVKEDVEPYTIVAGVPAKKINDVVVS
ncbi:acyltransferase [Methanosarcina sp. KYL-1]|uniref:acyltransferase n=1 Tax=Methanosarcina sp. KYL-1 TaxID=2602068 RepID=UPI002101C864|nr:acyltransferase [Methanosarcina sp. KYL-1]MCQ1535496.1 acyltransferase [Methanosarcina sp. KYL-1]